MSQKESKAIVLDVDLAPMGEADALIDSCEEFISQSGQELVVLPFPALSRIRNWRAKQRDNRLSLMYESLQPRVQDLERRLRSMIGDIVEKKRALRTQAHYHEARLQACMQYNNDLLLDSVAPINEIRELVNNLAGASVPVKSMMVFNNELLRQRNAAAVKQGKSFIPWAKRPSAVRPVSENELAADADHPVLKRRLDEIRKLKETFAKLLDKMLERREINQSNVENAAESRQTLLNLLRKDHSPEELLKFRAVFDHSKCADCVRAHNDAVTCIEDMVFLFTNAMAGNQKLHDLVEHRERMRDAAETYDLEGSLKGCSRSSSFTSANTSVTEDDDGTSSSGGPSPSRSGKGPASPISPLFMDTTAKLPEGISIVIVGGGDDTDSNDVEVGCGCGDKDSVASVGETPSFALSSSHRDQSDLTSTATIGIDEASEDSQSIVSKLSPPSRKYDDDSRFEGPSAGVAAEIEVEGEVGGGLSSRDPPPEPPMRV